MTETTYLVLGAFIVLCIGIATGLTIATMHLPPARQTLRHHHDED